MYIVGVAHGSAKPSVCYICSMSMWWDGGKDRRLASSVLLNRDGDDDDGGVGPSKVKMYTPY